MTNPILTITDFYNEQGEYKIPVLLDTAGLDVKLYLTSHNLGNVDRFGEITIIPNSTILKNLPFQFMVGDKYLYSTVLTANIFNHPDTYYGYVAAREKVNNTLTFQQNVIINLLQNPLDTKSPYSYNNQNLTRGQIIDMMYNQSFQDPASYLKEDDNQLFIKINNSKTDRPLPAGSYAKIFKKEDPRTPIVINKETKFPLGITDQNGLPIGVNNAQSIATKETSYLLITDLKSGEYFALVYSGIKQIAGPIFFYYK